MIACRLNWILRDLISIITQLALQNYSSLFTTFIYWDKLKIINLNDWIMIGQLYNEEVREHKLH